jgi:hypothetical protein
MLNFRDDYDDVSEIYEIYSKPYEIVYVYTLKLPLSFHEIKNNGLHFCKSELLVMIFARYSYLLYYLFFDIKTFEKNIFLSMTLTIFD